MSNRSPEKEGKLVYSIDTLKDSLTEEVSRLNREILAEFKRHLNDDSLTLFELGYLLVSGGLIDALGQGHVAYLRQKELPEKFIQRAKGFCDEIGEKYPDFFRGKNTRKDKRKEMVSLGACFLPTAGDASANLDRYYYLVEIVTGWRKPPDSWIRKGSQ